MDKYVGACALGAALLYRPAVAKGLIERFGSAEEVFRLHAKELSGFLDNDPELAEKILSADLRKQAEEEVKWAASKGVEILRPEDQAYPLLLKECYDAPAVLYYKGSAGLNNSRSVAMVGTRLASEYGRECCRRVVADFRDGGYHPLVVSGLAYGIDVASHKAALEYGLDTVGVLAGGIDLIYPPRHREVAKMMVRQGGILTEFPRGAPSVKINFIKRNRIIAGMVQGVVVVESRMKGGSMSTVEFANSYNRDVFAVPGRLTDFNSGGCNYLISKNVASVYVNKDTIPCGLGWHSDPGGVPGVGLELFSFEVELKEKILLSLKVHSSLSTERIMAATGLTFEKVASLLLELELEGRIATAGGSGYCLRK